VERPTCRPVFCSFPPYFGNNAHTSDNTAPHTLQRIPRICAVIGSNVPQIVAAAVLSLCLGACQAPELPAAGGRSQPATGNHACGRHGFLTTSLFGAIAGPIDWAAADLDCAGMPRPGGAGARLRFAGSENDSRIAIIIAMPALERGATGIEIASKVTLIEEGSGRFFSTAGLDSCWTDITTLESIGATDDRFTIGGTLYCVLPLAEVNGESSVSIPELRFQGLLDWNAS